MLTRRNYRTIVSTYFREYFAFSFSSSNFVPLYPPTLLANGEWLLSSCQKAAGRCAKRSSSCAILQNCARSGGLQTSSASIDVVAAVLRVVDDVLDPGALVAHPRCSQSACSRIQKLGPQPFSLTHLRATPRELGSGRQGCIRSTRPKIAKILDLG